jgi:hypothetical protein
MFLSALVDFPDDALSIYDEESLDAMVRTLRDMGVKRIHWQWYVRPADGLDWEHSAPVFENSKKTAKNLPEMSRSFVNAAKRYGLQTVAVMRPLETGHWMPFSPWYPYDGEPAGVPHIGGDLRIATRFLLAHPELRVKRRSYDTDPAALDKTICSIRLYKQNDYPTNITKDDIAIYVSDDNSRYRRYEDGFALETGREPCRETVVVEKFGSDYKDQLILSMKDAPVLTLTLSGLHIKERYTAVAVTGRTGNESAGIFCNALYHAIHCFDSEGSGGVTITKPDMINELKKFG